MPGWRLLAAEKICTASYMASSDSPPPSRYTISKGWILDLVEISGERGLSYNSKLHWTNQVLWMDAFETARCAMRHVYMMCMMQRRSWTHTRWNIVIVLRILLATTL